MLKLDPPQFATRTRVSLVIRTVTGAPISSNRVANLEVRATTDTGLAPALWPKLNTVPVLANGVVRVTNVSDPVPQQFFIVSEPQ
jgi:hypothetical protein